MPGGLIQLVATGAQDAVLTEDPEITFFKSVYRPYVNFALESIQQQATGTADFNRRATFDISRNGDLCIWMNLEIVIPAITVTDSSGVGGVGAWFRWAPNLGQTMILDVYVEIGGQIIDKHYGDW